MMKKQATDTKPHIYFKNGYWRLLECKAEPGTKLYHDKILAHTYVSFLNNQDTFRRWRNENRNSNRDSSYWDNFILRDKQRIQ